jgi:hypothetical protein
MAAIIRNIEINQGSDFNEVYRKVIDGTPEPLTDLFGRAMMRSDPSDALPAATFTVTIDDPSADYVRVFLSNSVTAGLTPGRYFWDLEIYSAGDASVTAWFRGFADVIAQVTK